MSAELNFIATLMTRIDDPSVDLREGIELAKTLHLFCHGDDDEKTKHIFTLALAKPHFRTWWHTIDTTTKHDDGALANILAVVPHDSAAIMETALAEFPAMDSCTRARIATECIVTKSPNSWKAVTRSGTLDDTHGNCAYLRTALDADEGAIFDDAIDRLVRAVQRGDLTSDAVACMIRSCRMYAQAGNHEILFNITRRIYMETYMLRRRRPTSR